MGAQDQVGDIARLVCERLGKLLELRNFFVREPLGAVEAVTGDGTREALSGKAARKTVSQIRMRPFFPATATNRARG